MFLAMSASGFMIAKTANPTSHLLAVASKAKPALLSEGMLATYPDCVLHPGLPQRASLLRVGNPKA